MNGSVIFTRRDCSECAQIEPIKDMLCGNVRQLMRAKLISPVILIVFPRHKGNQNTNETGCRRCHGQIKLNFGLNKVCRRGCMVDICRGNSTKIVAWYVRARNTTCNCETFCTPKSSIGMQRGRLRGTDFGMTCQWCHYQSLCTEMHHVMTPQHDTTTVACNGHCTSTLVRSFIQLLTVIVNSTVNEDSHHCPGFILLTTSNASRRTSRWDELLQRRCLCGWMKPCAPVGI